MDNLKIIYFRENSNKKVPAINPAKLMKYNPSGLEPIIANHQLCF